MRPGRLEPCLYRVTIGHSRLSPVTNRFRYGSYMRLFDLDRPPRGFGQNDHLDVRAELARAGIDRPEVSGGRVLVLTNTRTLGYVFNPLTVYWCYDRDDRLVAHVAEVHNTYGGRYAYVIPAEDGSEAVVAKKMYVSPFYPVDGNYRICIGDPGETLSISIALHRGGEETFRARLSGRRLEATVMNRVRSQVRYPAAPLRGRALIQLQGLRLWWRGLEVQPR